MEHLPDVPNPSPCIPLLVKSIATRVEAQEVILSDRVFVDWAEDPVLAASEAQKYLYFGLLACFSDCQLNLNLYIHDDEAYLNSHFNQYALGRRWLRKPTYNDNTEARLLLAAKLKTSWLCRVFPLGYRQPNNGRESNHRHIHLVCLSINLLVEHIQTALSSAGHFISARIAREALKIMPEWFNESYPLAVRFRNALTTLSLPYWSSFMIMIPPGDRVGDRVTGRTDVTKSIISLVESDQGDIFRNILLSGWCPSFVEFILANMSWSTCTYLSILKRPGIAHNLNVEGRKDCTTERCWDQVNEETYRTKHTMDGCICASLGPSSRMKDIVKRGGTPLLRLTYDRTGVPILTVEEATTSSMYIAISHVWSGGLGNPKANALPFCQLRQLAGNLDKVLRKITPAFSRLRDWLSPARSTLFWMDTLCIPVRDQSCENAEETKSSRETRQRAINGMQEIYMGAIAVLVIDPDLRHLNNSSSRHQIYGRVLTSSWMSRCWTFEEASMAAEVFVQLKDQPYRLRMHEPTQRSKVLDFRETLAGHLQKEMMSWTNDLPLAGGSAISAVDNVGRETITMAYPYTFIRLYNTILRRATSRESDRLVILSTMLNFRPIDLARFPPEQRLSRIIASLKFLPESILYMDHEPELSWDAKKSWLPTRRMIEHIPSERPYTDVLVRRQNNRWTLRVAKNQSQCLFVIPKIVLSLDKMLVTIEKKYYTLELWYTLPGIANKAFKFRPPQFFWNSSHRYVLLVRDRQWLLRTENSPSGTTACVLFELDRQTPEVLHGGLWKVSYIRSLECSLEGSDLSRTRIRNELEDISSRPIVLEFPVPECK